MSESRAGKCIRVTMSGKEFPLIPPPRVHGYAGISVSVKVRASPHFHGGWQAGFLARPREHCYAEPRNRSGSPFRSARIRPISGES